MYCNERFAAAILVLAAGGGSPPTPDRYALASRSWITLDLHRSGTPFVGSCPRVHSGRDSGLV